MDLVGIIKAILDTFFLTEMYTGTRDKLSPLQTSIQILLYVCAILAIVTVWEIQNPLMMSNTRWHLKHCYQNTDPTCLSQNNIWQVRDPGANSHMLLASARVSANVLCHESKLTVKSVKSSLLPLQSATAQVTHLVFMETAFNTPSHPLVAAFFHYVSTSKGQDAVSAPVFDWHGGYEQW